LNWLLHHIKKFNKGKNKAGKEPGTLGGCMYYLAVSLFISPLSNLVLPSII
jgi:hypothetical protein